MPYILSTAFIHPDKTERLKAWYREVEHRKAEVLETLNNEGVRQEIAFIVPTEHGDMLAVFSESDDPDKAGRIRQVAIRDRPPTPCRDGRGDRRGVARAQ